MSYSASQFEGITDAIYRSNGKKIPKDQEELLAKDGSWIHQLRKRTHGAVNVPNHVLQTVTAAHEVLVRQTASNTVPPAKNSSLEVVKSLQTCSTHASSPVASSPAASSPAASSPAASSPAASSPERLVSQWSASPPDHHPRHDDMPESSLIEETPHPQHLRAAFRRTPLEPKRPPDPVPKSSLEEEEEMDVQVPYAENDQDEDMTQDRYQYPYQRPSQRIQNKIAQMTNTPPCAQPDPGIVPATVNAEVAKRPGEVKRQRPVKRFKPIQLDDGPINPRGDGMTIRGSRMQSLKHLQVTETQDTVASSSVVAATLTQTQTQNAANTTKETNSDVFEEEEAQPFSRQLLGVVARSQISDDKASRRNSQNYTSTPLAEFTAAYPDYWELYKGTQLNFVRACMCLEWLRGERALRDYLYDDFIRLFSYKFLDYVNNAGPGQEPLPAIEWYNIQSGEPLYDRHVIKNDSLDRVLAFYKEEVVLIRNLTTQQEEEEQEQQGQNETTESVVSSRSTKPELASPTPPPEEVRDLKRVDSRKTEIADSVVVKKRELPLGKSKHERSIAQSASPSISLGERRITPAPTSALSVADSAPSPREASPQLGSRIFPVAPPSSMRSNAPRLATRQASTGEDAAQKRKDRMQAAMRKRASNGARSLSSRAGSAV
ncbi:hypothetical protein CCM_07601 [Cordyceps militaris CM01]|uniref:Uncharacterized protein n=1 Tax=Cordyceps militaris (strain CM01) TaxID=983644 RepID=G3JQ99_CORMM|nr:uncharacterized protein CCM_07601 [Cordyceps militaris CM01]EGX89350.1 hypothetical protein CCM_07601 [Cordyceps militaris CM01]